MKRPGKLLGAAFLGLVLLFLYVPILSVVAYSFNESKMVTLWTGFSLKWYGELLHDRELMDAAWLSLKLATATAFAAVFVGTWIGFVLARYRKFRGSTLFTAMVSAPMVLPEVIAGLSMLLFLAMQQLIGWPSGRGMLTIWIGHIMVCLSYVAITIQSRLVSMDQSLAEAAQNLGATPLRVFFDITLPQISQALIASWLLAFTISLDDVIMSAFLSGPGSNPLPLVVLSRVRLGLNPEINALGTLFIAAVTVMVLVNNHYMLKRERRREQEIRQALAGNASLGGADYSAPAAPSAQPSSTSTRPIKELA
ncbi:ABC transporter permease [Metapseudomonas resinovorans]|uniref:Polyamine ABC transporter permease protein SpuH n=1 Tax=Metapseudomonas resinovorans NBRC 106553 TaxID=1245471 RepID=S6AII1_METRE|nr:ABC transporter permease subunit [Pseudomonas resinovorans]BAN50457.1 polyamine ABC transporter permease protein SpuH [Pseudomonas resinovorans NBRC 106553]